MVEPGGTEPGSELDRGVKTDVSHPSGKLVRLRGALEGRYVVEREIGHGGMATVYLADDLKHRRKVAIKVLRPELGAVLGPDRFSREIEIAAGLSHPHILPLYDSGNADGLLFYVMPYIAGESLRQKLSRETQLRIGEAIEITRQVASALEYAHARGMVHRDIKPENILLHEGEAMVADFGIALIAGTAPDDRFTGTGIMVGTPAYMSPEQAAGERSLDGRSDVYSVACVLYELLAGEPPFTGPTAQAVITKRFTDPVPRIRRLRAEVPPGVEEALTQALAKVPADRFASAAAFADALTKPGVVQPVLPSVAVLPFLSLSTELENELFADGITEDVIAQLSKIRSLKVISRSSAMAFKSRDRSLREIAARLGVSTLLEGSVRRVGDRVRIVAQLIDADADQHLWSETYDRQLTDIFAIQTDVALHIAAALKAELSPDERTRIRREPTRDVHAYQLYLKGRHWYSRYTEEGYRKGIEYFRRAIAADPGYALAHAGVALVYAEFAAGQGGGTLKEDVAYQEGMSAVTRALELDNRLGEAHSVLALLKCVHDYDWEGAEREFKLALELNPGGADIYDHYGWLCSAQGRFEESLTLSRRAQELDPLVHRSDVANVLIRMGRYQEALEELQRSVDVDPEHARGRSTLGWAYLLSGRRQEGLAELEQAVALVPGNTLYLAQLGQALAMTGAPDQARDILRRLDQQSRESYVSPYHLAYVYTGLGELDVAMDLLERAYQTRAGSVYGVKGSYLFAPLRSHPRFQALLRKLNLA
jgi:serine/threonine-protein kinase